MIINPAKSKSVVEKENFILSQINENATEPTVNSLQELRSELLIKMHQVTSVMRAKRVAPPFQAADLALLDKVLARKDQAKISRFIPDWRTVRKYLFMRDPTNGKSGILIEMHPRCVELLVHHALHHPLKRGAIIL